MLVEPDNADGIAAIEVAVVAVLVPPACRVELGTVRTAHVVVRVLCAKRHVVGVLQCICPITTVAAYTQLVVCCFVSDLEQREAVNLLQYTT